MNLRDCPFCGQTAGVSAWGDGTGFRAHVECQSCRCATPRFETLSEAVSAWNRRNERMTRWCRNCDGKNKKAKCTCMKPNSHALAEELSDDSQKRVVGGEVEG